MSRSKKTPRWNIEFVDVTLDGEILTGGGYDYIILQLQSRLEDGHIRSSGITCPCLPEYETNNSRVRWFEIWLHLNEDTTIRLRLRRDDLYVVGFQVNNETWREFGAGGDDHLIEGSQFLGFTGSYNDLLRVAGLNLDQVTVGRQSLTNAARLLVNSSASADIAKAMLVLILMFCESARFHPVHTFVQSSFLSGATIPTWISNMIRRWGELSNRAMYYYHSPYLQWEDTTLEVEDQTVVITSLAQLLIYMGILLNNPAKYDPIS